MAGRFIVFEGIDGSGTTTVATRLRDYLASGSRPVVLTCEPSPGPIGSLIRLIHTRRVTSSADRAGRERMLSYLFAADREDHLGNAETGIVRLLALGCDVISTRYVLSSFAYHALSEADYERVTFLNRDFPLPDYTFYLDCPVDKSLERIAAARVPDLNEERANLERVRRCYERAIGDYRGALWRLDAAGSAEAVFSEVLAVLGSR